MERDSAWKPVVPVDPVFSALPPHEFSEQTIESGSVATGSTGTAGSSRPPGSNAGQSEPSRTIRHRNRLSPRPTTEAGKLGRLGKWKKGDPYKFWRPHSAQTPNTDGQNESSDVVSEVL